MTLERCPVCDAPLATESDYDEWDTLWCAKTSAALLGEERPDIDLDNWRPDLCWPANGCKNPPVDWRARALAAEAERDAGNATLRKALEWLQCKDPFIAANLIREHLGIPSVDYR